MLNHKIEHEMIRVMNMCPYPWFCNLLHVRMLHVYNYSYMTHSEPVCIYTVVYSVTLHTQIENADCNMKYPMC